MMYVVFVRSAFELLGRGTQTGHRDYFLFFGHTGNVHSAFALDVT